jgi:predicted transposase YdaD
MQSSFDPTIKTLAEVSPGDWLKLVRRRRKRVTVEDTDVGIVVSGAGDKLFRVHDRPPYLLHLDFESGHFQSGLPSRLRMYNSIFSYRHRCFVLSAVILLRPEANSPRWSGTLRQELPGYAKVSQFEHEVIRVWELDPQELLAGGVGTLALAPISNVHQSEVRGIIREMKARLSATSVRQPNDIWAATYVLMGLRYSDEFTHALFQEVLGMKESATYQAIIREGRTEGRAEGRVEEAREIVLKAGESKFKTPPSSSIRDALEALDDVSELEALVVRMFDVNSWEELLPAPPRGRRRRRSS